MKKVKATITLLLAMTLVLQGTLAADHSSILHRADRILQSSTSTTTSGSINFTPTPDPAVKKYCDDAGIPATDISITNQQRKDLQAENSGRYSTIIQNVDDSMKNGNGNVSNDLVKAAFGTGLGFGIICGVLAFLSWVFLFFWAVTECCCKKTCCAETQKKAEEEDGSDGVATSAVVFLDLLPSV